MFPPGIDSKTFAPDNSGINAQIQTTTPKDFPVVKEDPKAVPPEGFLNRASGEFSPPAGGFLDLNTGLYIPPPNLGSFDPSTGQYQAPVGLELDPSGKFVENPDEAGGGDTAPIPPPLPPPNSFGEGAFNEPTTEEGILINDDQGNLGPGPQERGPATINDSDIALVEENEDDTAEIEDDSDLTEILDEENDPSSGSGDSSSEDNARTTLELSVTVQ